MNKKDLIIDQHINSIPDAIHFLISERKDSTQLDRIENSIKLLLNRDRTE